MELKKKKKEKGQKEKMGYVAKTKLGKRQEMETTKLIQRYETRLILG